MINAETVGFFFVENGILTAIFNFFFSVVDEKNEHFLSVCIFLLQQQKKNGVPFEIPLDFVPGEI